MMMISVVVLMVASSLSRLRTNRLRDKHRAIGQFPQLRLGHYLFGCCVLSVRRTAKLTTGSLGEGDC